MKPLITTPKNKPRSKIIATIHDGPLPAGLVPSSYKKGQVSQLVSSLVSAGQWIRASRTAAKRFTEEAATQLKSIELLEDPKDRSAIFIKYLGPFEQLGQEYLETDVGQGVESEADAMIHGV